MLVVDVSTPLWNTMRNTPIVRKRHAELDPTGAARASRWNRLNRSLARTRVRIAAGLGDLVLGERAIDEAVLDELETALLVADVGVAATDRVISALKDRVSRRELETPRP